mmetsp:Transcript_7558/g.23844  ORF Transcript_7558/g.23844 Transcript_7558/m.23844 type:complete len:230 (-) Transcript_7558:12-701(-)
MMRPQRKRRLAARLFLAYVFLEIVSYLRYRRRLARLRQPRLAYRRGSLDDLRLVLRQVKQASCPLTVSAASMQIYLDERERESGSGQPAPKVSWRHYYASMQHAFCIEGPSPEEHSLLLQIAKASALRQGLPPPPAGAAPPSAPPPVAFGSAPVSVFHKPLPVEVALSAVRGAAEAVFRLLGFSGRWVETPEGRMRYWVSEPREGEAEPGLLPAVFLHGGPCPTRADTS